MQTKIGAKPLKVIWKSKLHE